MHQEIGKRRRRSRRPSIGRWQWLVFAAGGGAWLVWSTGGMNSLEWGAVGIMSAIAIATGWFTFPVGDRTDVSFSTAVYAATVALFGPAAGAWTASIANTLLEATKYRRGVRYTAAEVGAHVLAAAASGALYFWMKRGTTGSELTFLGGARIFILFASFAALLAVERAVFDWRGAMAVLHRVRRMLSQEVAVEMATACLCILLVMSYVSKGVATFPLLAILLVIGSAAWKTLWDTRQTLLERVRELHEMQSKLVESGKMAAVGELAAGVAHELNNPIGGILGYAQFDLEKAVSHSQSGLRSDEMAPLIRHLSFIERESKRCSAIVKNLLQFAQSEKTSFLPLDVNDVVEDALQFTAGQLTSYGVEVETDLEDGLPQVVGDRGQLQQVFANIIINARNAMGSEGRLRVFTESVASQEGGQEVKVSFEDTGCGINPENLSRIFEPFFTTQKVGDGTGLGLSVSYGIVREHGGDIEVESEVGAGSMFSVLLPVLDENSQLTCQ